MARNIQAQQCDSQEHYQMCDVGQDFQIQNPRWSDHRQWTSVCLYWICSVHQGLWHRTHSIQSLSSISKWMSRKNCSDCQMLLGESKRSIQSVAQLQKQSSRHWTLSCPTVPRPVVKDGGADNMQTHTTRTRKLQGMSQWNDQSTRDAEILLQWESDWEAVAILSWQSSHDEGVYNLEESQGGDSSNTHSQRWA